MIVIWKADFEGTDKDLERVNKKFDELSKKHGYKYDGPYYPQDAALLFVMNTKKFQDLNKSGREFLRWVAREKIPITPLSYEVAVTPKEFWG